MYCYDRERCCYKLKVVIAPYVWMTSCMTACDRQGPLVTSGYERYSQSTENSMCYITAFLQWTDPLYCIGNCLLIIEIHKKNICNMFQLIINSRKNL